MTQPGMRSTGSPIKKRSIVIGNHKTSISLEDEFWEGLKYIARSREISLSDLLVIIEGEREQANLSSAIRLFVLDYYRSRLGVVATNTPGGGLSLETKAVHYQ
jgi:predicted DNA-binding ribbon-helix-helix protein